MELENAIEKGISLAKEGLYTEAIRVFEEDLCFTQNPTAMAYYALCLASAEGNYDKAISLCLMAAEREFYNPEIYLNLGRIFLLNGQKSVAVKAFRKGLSFDCSNNTILFEIRKLGVRRRPVISFLPRDSFFNKYLGMLVQKIA